MWRVEYVCTWHAPKARAHRSPSLRPSAVADRPIHNNSAICLLLHTLMIDDASGQLQPHLELSRRSREKGALVG